MENNGKKLYIAGYSLLIVIIGLVFAYLFSGYSRTEAKVEGYKTQVEEIKSCVGDMKTDIGIIKTDISWIKSALGQRIK